VIQALWLLDQSNLGRTTGGLSAFDLPLFVDRGSDVLGASVDPRSPTTGGVRHCTASPV
jgi:hypothetical protein